jgi:hypothetical protein
MHEIKGKGDVTEEDKYWPPTKDALYGQACGEREDRADRGNRGYVDIVRGVLLKNLPPKQEG